MAFNTEAIMWILFGVFLTMFVRQLIKVAYPKAKIQKNKDTKEEDDGEWESDDDTDDDQIGAPDRPEGYDEALFKTYPITDLKMMMAVRNDLGM